MDFGISQDWEHFYSDIDTEGISKDWTYTAPEVMNTGRSNDTSDIWSLGCIFLEMATVLKGLSIEETKDFFIGNHEYYEKTRQIENWVRRLRLEYSNCDNLPLTWSMLMLQDDPEKRPTADDLCAKMLRSARFTDAGIETFFCDLCMTTSDTELMAISEASDDLGAEYDNSRDLRASISTLTSCIGTQDSSDQQLLQEDRASIMTLHSCTLQNEAKAPIFLRD